MFAAFNILNGKVMGSCWPRHRGKEFIQFLNQLEKEVAPELDIHLILDNYSTHKSAAVRRWLKLGSAAVSTSISRRLALPGSIKWSVGLASSPIK